MSVFNSHNSSETELHAWIMIFIQFKDNNFGNHKVLQTIVYFSQQNIKSQTLYHHRIIYIDITAHHSKEFATNCFH